MERWRSTRRGRCRHPRSCPTATGGRTCPSPTTAAPCWRCGPTSARRILEMLTVLYGPERAEACDVEVERLMKVYHAHKTPEMLAEEPQLRPDGALQREGRHPHHLRRPARPARARRRCGRSRTSSTSSCAAPSTRCTSCRSSPTPPTAASRSSTTRRWTRGSGPGTRSTQLSRRFRLMFDGVFNHASAKSRWFQRFLNGRPGYEDFFVAFDTQRRDRSRPPAAHPAARARPTCSPRFQDLQRPALGVDHVQPGPGGPQLQERAGAAARASTSCSTTCGAAPT